MAAEVAHQLLKDGKIDLVVCFAPSVSVVDSLREAFSQTLGRRFDGRMGSAGGAFTYQSMAHLHDSFWELFEDYRVMVVFDEIHHCAGSDPLLSNAWGQQILLRIQQHATVTLALSGTPWRSDEQSIVLARYSNPEGQLICDYSYGLREAVSDLVCRSPRIVLVDNGHVILTEEAEPRQPRFFPSIGGLLRESAISYDDVLQHNDAIQQILSLGTERLDRIRTTISDAAGLVVTSSVAHAQQVAAMLASMGETFQVATYKAPNAQQVIEGFRTSTTCRWIVTVGMISEGTDIPRLQVCCHLSRVRTELHFRQVLGRILRRRSTSDDQAWLYVLAEPALERFSRRIGDDLPDDLAVVSEVSGSTRAVNGKSSSQELPGEGKIMEKLSDSGLAEKPSKGQPRQLSEPPPALRLELSQHFRHQVLALF
ncbi:hypothetical protein SAMN05661010_02109 [Modicisalibacter muralis]|uniref:Superfamily II DNA or RNA helicase n=2 Tax=Modicisalibacter muralis TaxID=119000 RepID=A0A1G9LIM3_9GAMM|nr:hypothetical protein SAMN05661010_02109 [Halomonas muralis]